MNEQLTVSEKLNYSTKDISKIARVQLKKEFPNCTFSVTTEHYSGGSSISLSLMKADFKIVKDVKDIPEEAFERLERLGRYTREQVISQQAKSYHQLNHYHFNKEYDEIAWNNGVFLTEQADNILRRAVQIIQHYNWDHSDIQTDYFDVHFYLHVNIGKWDKPFVEKGL
jgi:hypothetical protein